MPYLLTYYSPSNYKISECESEKKGTTFHTHTWIFKTVHEMENKFAELVQTDSEVAIREFKTQARKPKVLEILKGCQALVEDQEMFSLVTDEVMKLVEANEGKTYIKDDYVICKTCHEKCVLVADSGVSLYPDEEPYKAGEPEDIYFELTTDIQAYLCRSCEELHDLSTSAFLIE